MTLPQWIKDTIKLRTDGVCWYCGHTLLEPYGTHIDHVNPVVQNGTDDLANLVPTCQACNLAKGGRTLEEYRAKVEGKQSNIPYFNPPQLAWLSAHGFNVAEHRTKGHRFYFEIHNLGDRPLPTPEEAGWLVCDISEEGRRLLLALAKREKLSLSAYIDRLARTNAGELGITYDPDHPALATLKRKADRTKEHAK